MKHTRLTILPIVVVFMALILGWSTVLGEAAENIQDQIRKINELPPNSEFTWKLDDDEISDAANEYLDKYAGEIEEMIRSAIGTKVDLSDAHVEFKPNTVNASVKAGKGFLKVSASTQAEVTWDGKLHVNVKDVDVPIVSVDPAAINSLIQTPVERAVNYLEQYVEIRSITIGDGYVEINAVRK